MTLTLTNKEFHLLLHYLDDLYGRMSGQGCNDLSKEIEKMFTKKEVNKILQEFNKYNNKNNCKDDNIDWPIPDFCLLRWLRNKIVKQNDV